MPRRLHNPVEDIVAWPWFLCDNIWHVIQFAEIVELPEPGDFPITVALPWCSPRCLFPDQLQKATLDEMRLHGHRLCRHCQRMAERSVRNVVHHAGNTQQ